MFTLDSLHRAMADKAEHGGYTLKLLNNTTCFGQFVLTKGTDKIHFTLEVDGNQVKLWEGKDAAVIEMIPQTFTNVSPLGLLAVILRYRIYSLLDGKTNT